MFTIDCSVNSDLISRKSIVNRLFLRMAVKQLELGAETRNKFLSEVGVLHNDCTKTMFVNLLTNEQLIQRFAQFITNCFEIRSVVRG